MSTSQILVPKDVWNIILKYTQQDCEHVFPHGLITINFKSQTRFYTNTIKFKDVISIDVYCDIDRHERVTLHMKNGTSHGIKKAYNKHLFEKLRSITQSTNCDLKILN